MTRLQDEQAARRRADFVSDLATYRKIRDSLVASQAEKTDAWNALCDAWNVDPGVQPSMLRWNDATRRAELAWGAVAVTVSLLKAGKGDGQLPGKAELNVDGNGWKPIQLPWIERGLAAGIHRFELRVNRFRAAFPDGHSDLTVSVIEDRTSQARFLVEPLQMTNVTFRVETNRPAKHGNAGPGSRSLSLLADRATLDPAVRRGALVLLHKAETRSGAGTVRCTLLKVGRTNRKGRLSATLDSVKLADADIHYLCPEFQHAPRDDRSNRRIESAKENYHCRLVPLRPNPATRNASVKSTSISDDRACLKLTVKALRSGGKRPVTDAFVLAHCHRAQTCRLVRLGVTDYKGKLSDPLVPKSLFTDKWQISEIVVVADRHTVGRCAYRGGQVEHTVSLEPDLHFPPPALQQAWVQWSNDTSASEP